MRRTVIRTEEKWFSITSYAESESQREPYDYNIVYYNQYYKNDEECEELLEKAKKDYIERKPFGRKPPVLEIFWNLVSQETKYDY